MNWIDIIMIIIVLLGIISFTFFLVLYNNEKIICSEKHGGIVSDGYCVYTENGNSKSYFIWERENDTG